jgi:hypothetical protein
MTRSENFLRTLRMRQKMDTFFVRGKQFLWKYHNVEYSIYDQSKEADETNILSHHLIVNTNRIDFNEKIESLEMFHHSRIKLRLSGERRVSNSIE